MNKIIKILYDEIKNLKYNFIRYYPDGYFGSILRDFILIYNHCIFYRYNLNSYSLLVKFNY